MSTALTAPSLPAALRAGAKTATPAPEGARGLSALLLAAAIATLIVVADQLIDTWADGHLMLAWVILWALVFAGLALFADGARRLARRSVAAGLRLQTWSATAFTKLLRRRSGLVAHEVARGAFVGGLVRCPVRAPRRR